MKKLPNIYADFGNSRLKLLLGDKVEAYDYDSHEWIESAELSIMNYSDKSGFFYSSVNDKPLQKLKTSPVFNLLKFSDAYQRLKEDKPMDLSGVEGLGSDRAFGVFGASAFADPPLITVDCGTATTVNVLDENMKFLGGAIFAGAKTQIKALSVNAAILKDFDPLHTDRVLGQDTKSAITIGAFSSVAGGVKMIIENIEKERFNGRKIPVFITGGFGKIVTDMLANWDRPLIYEPNLVLLGVKMVCEK